MKTLTVSALVCAMMALAGAAEGAPEEDQMAKSHLVKGSTACSGGWTLLHDRCFHYVPRALRWAEAEKHCVFMGGNLASVHSAQEYHSIQALMISTSHQYKETWIGGSDAEEEKQWFWSDGTPFHYLNWCSGEPNNMHQQNCLQMNYGADKCWDDDHCSRQKPSVCAKKKLTDREA
ncbi:type-2 ice-structuring protein-like isoform X2 [Cyclopterus lumpus]|uniref:type-2 ice-structuring protein-like isoform X2 n=1 Tax=Cyclopterus lumpus TaxID=8103 RepID=UPI001486B6C8|nr:type-2 ice-structuring protein-like isoform X2 [Cyclopterus lumpus]